MALSSESAHLENVSLLKILHVNHLIDPISGGGTAERTFQITRSALREAVDCAILTLDIGDTKDCERKLNTARIVKLPCWNRRYFIPAIWPHKLYKLISEFDVVHLMGHWTLLNALVASICLFQHKPYVVCPAGALKPFGRSKFLKWLYNFIIGRRIIRSASGWVAITDDERSDFRGYGINPDSVDLIPNGVDPENYPINETTSEKSSLLNERFSLSGKPYILFLGRLNQIKGPDLLLEAFNEISDQFPDIHLIFAGPDSGLMESLKEKVISFELKHRVHFAGYLGGSDKINALQNARLLAIPSREEAMSLVVLEAGMCGTPVVFTDRCGLNDFYRDGAGLMVQATKDSIRQGLLNALSSPEEFGKSGKRLQALVKDRFLWNIQVKRYLALYRKIFNTTL